MKKVFWVVTLVTLLCSLSAEAQVPHLMRYQGVLLDHSGQPLEGVHTLNFRIYDAASGGNLLWAEGQTGIPVTQGSFSVLLGQGIPLSIPFDKDYYLTTEVDTDGEMSPRQKITSSPYAYRAEVADRAEVAEQVGDSLHVTPEGNVGIGTTGPNHKLEISGGDSDLVYLSSSNAGLELRSSAANGVAYIDFTKGSTSTAGPGTPDNSGRIGYNELGTGAFAITGGNVGIGTETPENILTVRQGSPTDPVADSWTIYPSDRAHKAILQTNPVGYLDRLRAVQTYEWKRIPLVSDEEARASLGERHPAPEALETRRQALASAKAALPKFTARRVGVVIDDENVPPEILVFNPDGTKAGIDLLGYIGYLHAALKEATLKMDALESRLNAIEKQ